LKAIAKFNRIQCRDAARLTGIRRGVPERADARTVEAVDPAVLQLTTGTPHEQSARLHIQRRPDLNTVEGFLTP
jgi:hypothetical protein